MIDGFLNTLRKTGERVQRRGEEVAQAAKLRLDVFQLNRELDALYARLGRAYHSSAAVSTLEEIRTEISRVDEEIAAREKLMAELGADLDGVTADAPEPGVNLSKAAVAPATDAQDSPAARDAQTALSVWRQKEATRMSDSTDMKTGTQTTGTMTTGTLTTGPATDATGRPDGETADPTTTAGGDPHAPVYSDSKDGSGHVTHPNEAGHGDKLQPTPDTASMGDEAARDRMSRHENTLKEGELATRDPDPLASKD
jgi:hypothetical protein